MLLCRTGWMRNYGGLSHDSLKGGAKYIKKHGFGHEIYNFLPSGGKVYGYVQYEGALELGRIDPVASGTDSIDHVTVVWAAPHPKGGVYVVGWYRNATVFSEMRLSPNSRRRVDPEKPSQPCWWSVLASTKDVQLVPPDSRWLRVPKSLALRSYVRYLDGFSAEVKSFRTKLHDYLAGGWRTDENVTARHGKYQQDLVKRLEIERVAMHHAAAYYERRGFDVTPVHKDNRGWDLEAARHGTLLRVEVKGCSGPSAGADLTPNEFAKFSNYPDSYRLCFVTDALGKPRVKAFAWSADDGKWMDDSGSILRIQELTGARVWEE